MSQTHARRRRVRHAGPPLPELHETVAATGAPLSAHVRPVAGLLHRSLQALSRPGLVVGDADAAVEVEADAAADRALQVLDGHVAPPAALGRLRPALARRADPARADRLDDGFLQRLTSTRAGGTRLAPPLARTFGAALGGDVSQVRTHVGPEAAALNRAVGAKAFAVGSDVYFRDGMPDVGRPEGAHLLAHELAHTLQPEAVPAVRRYRDYFGVPAVPGTGAYRIADGVDLEHGKYHIKVHPLSGTRAFDEIHVVFEKKKAYFFYDDDAVLKPTMSTSGTSKGASMREAAQRLATAFVSKAAKLDPAAVAKDLAKQEALDQERLAREAAHAKKESEKAASAEAVALAKRETALGAERDDPVHVENFLKDQKKHDNPADVANVKAALAGTEQPRSYLKKTVDWYAGQRGASWSHTVDVTAQPADAISAARKKTAFSSSAVLAFESSRKAGWTVISTVRVSYPNYTAWAAAHEAGIPGDL